MVFLFKRQDNISTKQENGKMKNIPQSIHVCFFSVIMGFAKTSPKKPEKSLGIFKDLHR